MKVHLLLPEGRESPAGIPAMSRDALRRDLDLRTAVLGIAGRDDVIYDSLMEQMFTPLLEPELLRWRHETLRDVLEHPEEVMRLYRICLEADHMREGRVNWLQNYDVSTTYQGAVNYLLNYSTLLRLLRRLAEEYTPLFKSVGFSRLFRTLQEELSDEYLESVRRELEGQKLALVDGVLLSAGLNEALETVDYVMHRREKSIKDLTIFKGQLYRLGKEGSDDNIGKVLAEKMLGVTFNDQMASEPDGLARDDLTVRQERAVNRVANALAQSAEYLASFFDRFRKELGFYIGGLRFTQKMTELGMPWCIPVLTDAESNSRSWEELYDVSLAYRKKAAVVGNTLTAESKNLYIVTGANQGGKTTFLRSFGQAQLMAQSGLPVGAKAYSAPYRRAVFTHFRQEEDRFLKSGKLDKELEWMDRIADQVRNGDLVLFNESFASTNEREGSEIGREITEALIESGVEAVSVSHLHMFAASFRGQEGVQFLRAERLESGQRTFRLLPGEPEETAYGEDIYQRVFGGCSSDTEGQEGGATEWKILANG